MRYQALCQEWISAFPGLPIIIDSIAQKLDRQKFGDIPTKEIWEDLILRILDDGSVKHDPLWKIAEKAAKESSPNAILRFAREVVCLLYRVGVLSIKSPTDSRFQYSDKDSPLVSSASIHLDTKFRLHPMLILELGGKGLLKAA